MGQAGGWAMKASRSAFLLLMFSYIEPAIAVEELNLGRKRFVFRSQNSTSCTCVFGNFLPNATLQIEIIDSSWAVENPKS